MPKRTPITRELLSIVKKLEAQRQQAKAARRKDT